jgi:hypothetical protein
MTRNMMALVLVILGMMVGVLLWGAHQARRSTELAGELRVLRREVALSARAMDSLRKQAGRRDTVFRTKWVPTWDSVRVQDTVMRGDTVYVPRDVADSTIGACTLALTSCQRLGIAQDSVIAKQAALITVLERKPGPCKVLGARCEILTLIGGVLLGATVAK